MTPTEKSSIRRMISTIFADYGRVKGMLESDGKLIDSPQGVFIVDKEKNIPKNSFLFEIDGLNQVWNLAETIRDKIEDVINFETTTYDELLLITKNACKEFNDSLLKIEKDIKNKQKFKS